MTENQKAKIVKLRAAGHGYGTIAQQLGISVNTVKSFCRRKNITAETASSYSPVLSGKKTFCDNCGKEIKQRAKVKPRRFCCDNCRTQWWNSHLDQVRRSAYYTFRCLHCGKEFQVYGDGNRKYCSHACYITARFKGGDHHD